MNGNTLWMKLVAATLAAAALMTVTIKGGWLIWAPVLMALWVVSRMWRIR